MTVQVDSQPVTEQNIWYIDMCCINNSISCLKKKTTFGTHEQTWRHAMSNSMLVSLPHFVSLKFTSPELIGQPSVKLVYLCLTNNRFLFNSPKTESGNMNVRNLKRTFLDPSIYFLGTMVHARTFGLRQCFQNHNFEYQN